MNPLLGIGLKIASAFTFTVMAACIKAVTASFPVGQLVFCRCLFALVPLIIWLRWNGEWPDALRTQRWPLHLRRGFIGGAGMFLGFTALSYLPLPDATAISFAAPLLTVVLAALLLKERVRVYRWSAVGIGFIGVLIMLWPQLGGLARAGAGGRDGIGAMFALAAAICAAFSTIDVRRLTETERTGTIVFYMCVIMGGFGLATIVAGWRLPDAREFAILVAMGALGGIAQIMLTQSYYHADASLVAPFDYTTMIFALGFGWWLFGDFPTRHVLVGAAIVVAAGIFVIWREHRLGLARRAARQASPPRSL